MNGESWVINPATKDIQVANGVPVKSKSLNTPVYVRYMAHRTQWLYAPNPQWGSDFFLAKEKQISSSPTALTAIGKRALQPILDDGRATEVDVSIAQRNRSATVLATQVTDSTGEVQQPSLVPIGV